ncbi:hypothetical protein JR338_01715 [Chloroflexota bacterium]|nr:hypothetical protein JR338_01715 [Chloroflexota bacterium]
MNDIHGLINVGVILLFLGIRALISGPTDSTLGSILAPYFLTPVGFLGVIVGSVRYFLGTERPTIKKIAQTFSWIMMPLGVMIVLFEWIGAAMREKSIELLLSNWLFLVIGLVIIILGYLAGRYAKK